MDNNIKTQKEEYLRTLQTNAKYFKPLLIIGLLLLLVTVVVFATCDMAHMASGFLGIPTVEYTGAFWTCVVLLIFGVILLRVALVCSPARSEYNKVKMMTDDEFVSYMKIKKAKTAAKVLWKIFGS